MEFCSLFLFSSLLLDNFLIFFFSQLVLVSQHGNIMYVGVDTFHDSGAKGGSRAAVAVVGTLDTLSTEYCSRVFFQAARQEIGDMLGNSVGREWGCSVLFRVFPGLASKWRICVTDSTFLRIFFPSYSYNPS